jgi:hypothetical protein
MIVFSGRYVGELECRDRRWGIARRRVVHGWSDSYPVRLYAPFGVFAQGGGVASRDPSSALFPRMGLSWGRHIGPGPGSAREGDQRSGLRCLPGLTAANP